MPSPRGPPKAGSSSSRRENKDGYVDVGNRFRKKPPHYLSDEAVAHHVEFSADRKYFCVALEGGFAIHMSDTSDCHLSQEVTSGVGFACIASSTSSVGIISGGDLPEYGQHRLSIRSIDQHDETAYFTSPTPIVRAVMNDIHVVLVLERYVAVYKFYGQFDRIALFETWFNPLGLCCLGWRYLVFPAHSAGQLQIIDLSTMKGTLVPAHSSELRAIDLSQREDMVATACAKGTLLRVHSTSAHHCLAEFRRGINEATILSLSISPESDRLAATSDPNHTLHIFDLIQTQPLRQVSNQSETSTSTANPSQTPTSPVSMAVSSPSPSSTPSSKYGILSRIPFVPRFLKDIYPTVSVSFNPGTELEDVNATDGFVDIPPAVPGGSRAKGVVSWVDNHTIVIVNAGANARYERFILSNDDSGKLVCTLDAWRKYLVQG